MVRISMQEIMGDFHPEIYKHLQIMWYLNHAAAGSTWRASRAGPVTSFRASIGKGFNRSHLERAIRKSRGGVRRRSP